MKVLLIILSFLMIATALLSQIHIQPAKKFDAVEDLAKSKNYRLIKQVEDNYGEAIRRICKLENVSPILMSGAEIEKIIIVESSGNPDKKPDWRKPNDGYGLMGVKRETARGCDVYPDSLNVPFWNLQAGIRYLNSLLSAKGIDGNLPAAIVAYNCGLGKYRQNYLKVGVSPLAAKYYQKVKILVDAENRPNQLSLDE